MWNDLFQWANEQWGAIMATGSAGLLAVYAFIAKPIKDRKINLDFGGLKAQVASQLSVVFDKVTELSKEFSNLKANVIAVTQASQIKDEQIGMLSDMIVQTISVANIPLAQKAEFYSALNHVAIVSDNVKKVLEQSINASQEEVIVQETINEEIKSDLNEV